MICTKKQLEPLLFYMVNGIFLIVFILFSASQAFGGTISGTIKFLGEVPPPVVHKTGKYSKVCGKEISGEALLVNNQKVRNVVVWLSGKDRKKLKGHSEGEFELNQKNCAYEPHLLVMPKDSELEIHTSDPINHNIHTYSFDNDPINLMFVPGQEYSQEFEESEVVKVECDLHSWMQAWIVVTPNAYYAVTGENGTYKIADVPPGKYTLNVWHELMGSKTKKIKVGDGPLEINLDFSTLEDSDSED